MSSQLLPDQQLEGKLKQFIATVALDDKEEWLRLALPTRISSGPPPKGLSPPPPPPRAYWLSSTAGRS